VGLGLGTGTVDASPPASSGAASARLGGGLESDDSDGGSDRSDRSRCACDSCYNDARAALTLILVFLLSSGREEKGSQGSGGGGHGAAPSSSSSRAASRARRRGHGHGKRPSAWDVIPSLANDGQVITTTHARL
jgi:hypothetical protein